MWLKMVLALNEAKLIRYTMGLVRDLDVARDVVQDAFLKLWLEEWPRIKGHETPWLFTVCRNASFDLLRKQKLHREKDHQLALEVPEQILTPEEQASNMDQKDLLNLVIAKLSPAQREILELKFHQDLSYKEISDVTGHSVNHVGVLIHRIIAELATAMKKKGERKGSL